MGGAGCSVGGDGGDAEDALAEGGEAVSEIVHSPVYNGWSAGAGSVPISWSASRHVRLVFDIVRLPREVAEPGVRIPDRTQRMADDTTDRGELVRCGHAAAV